MSFAPSTPLTGAAITGFTSPTYTLVADSAPNNHSKQFAVTALGGTQAGVNVNSVSKPFTITCERPANFKQLPAMNRITGQLPGVPHNNYVVRTRKGVIPLVDQAARIASIETKISIPAGSDIADLANLQAMVSAHIGALWNTSAGLGMTVGDGSL